MMTDIFEAYNEKLIMNDNNKVKKKQRIDKKSNCSLLRESTKRNPDQKTLSS